MLRNLILTTFAFILFSGCAQIDNRAEISPASQVPVQKKLTPNVAVKGTSSYKLFGKTYHILPTSKNYQATGTASWYGKQFHKKHTSSGERFNMYRLTAAHKTLPLPTYVQVTNLKNGRKITVKVNDRGPFVGDRLIDLSYAAAKKLGMVNQGVIAVKIVALPKNA